MVVENVTEKVSAIRIRRRRPLLADIAIRLVREKPLGTIGACIVLLLLIVGIFANFLAPYGFDDFVLSDRLASPSATHLLGADNVGRDVLSRIIYGARVSMVVGLSVSSISLGLALLIALPTGFYGGKLDMIVQRFVDAWMCFPSLILVLSIMAVLGPGMVQVILVLGVISAIGTSRVLRSAVMDIKANAYVQAATALGASDAVVIFKHILPNIIAPVIVLFTIHIGSAIISEASISFLGFGIPPPTPSWGGMLSGRGREFMLRAPWMALWPGVALALVVYGINMFGDAVRDLVDPRLRGGVGRYSGVASRLRKGLAKRKR